jgi:hypothetical protein
LKEKQLEKLAQGLLTKIITIRDQPLKGRGWLDLKSMYECTKQLKRKAIIRNEIMIHFNFPKPIANNQKPYHYYKMWVQFSSPCSLDQWFTAFSLVPVHYNHWIHSKSSEITWCTSTPFVVVYSNDVWTEKKL